MFADTRRKISPLDIKTISSPTHRFSYPSGPGLSESSQQVYHPNSGQYSLKRLSSPKNSSVFDTERSFAPPLRNSIGRSLEFYDAPSPKNFFSQQEQLNISQSPYLPEVRSPASRHSNGKSSFPSQSFSNRAGRKLRTLLREDVSETDQLSDVVDSLREQSGILRDISQRLKQDSFDHRNQSRRELERKLTKLVRRIEDEESIDAIERGFTSRTQLQDPLRRSNYNSHKQLPYARIAQEELESYQQLRGNNVNNDYFFSHPFYQMQEQPMQHRQFSGFNQFSYPNQFGMMNQRGFPNQFGFTNQAVFLHQGQMMYPNQMNSYHQMGYPNQFCYMNNAGSPNTSVNPNLRAEKDKENTAKGSSPQQKSLRKFMRSNTKARRMLHKEHNEDQSEENENDAKLFSKKKQTGKTSENKVLSEERPAKISNPRGKLAVLSWAIAFTAVLKKEVLRATRQRKTKRLKMMDTNQSKIVNSAQEFIKAAIHKELEPIYKGTKLYSIVCLSENKKFNEKEAIAKVKEFYIPRVRRIFDLLITYTTEMTLDTGILNFMASISENNCVPPANFYTNFELKRLRFTEFGTLKGITNKNAKMVIGMFLFIRTLVFDAVLYPWTRAKTLVEGIKYNATADKNLRTFGSILHILFNEYIRKRVPVDTKSQINLAAEDKIKPMSGGRLIYIPQGVDPDDYRKQFAPKDEAISGLYTREELYCLFKTNKAEADSLSAFVDLWLEKLYNITHNYYVQNRKTATMMQGSEEAKKEEKEGMQE